MTAQGFARGERMGQPLYGTKPGQDPAAVVEAYRIAGSFNGAARILNGTGLASAFGRKFAPSSVRDIVMRLEPDLAPAQPLKGVAAGGGFALSQLLRCAHDGRFLTGSHRRPGGPVVYRCHGADGQPDHPYPASLTEKAIMPWVLTEWGRYREPQPSTSPQNAPTRDPAVERAGPWPTG